MAPPPLSRSTTVVIPSPTFRRDTATNSDASARRRSITLSSSTSGAVSRLRRIDWGDAKRRDAGRRALSAKVVENVVTRLQANSRAAQQRGCDLRRVYSVLRDTSGGSRVKSRVSSRRGPTHDMAKVSTPGRKKKIKHTWLEPRESNYSESGICRIRR